MSGFQLPTTTTAASTGFSFGSLATNTQAGQAAPAAQTAFSFGTPKTTAAATSGFTGLSGFGTPAATATPSTGGLSFGTPTAAAAPSTGLSFGTPKPAATTASGFSFGTPAAPAAAATTAAPASSGFSFGTPAATAAPAAASTTSSGFSFGSAPAAAPASTPAPAFGLGGTAATTSAPSLGTSFSFGKTTTAATLNFGTSTTTTTAALPAFGATSGGLFGAKPGGLTLGAPATTTAVPTTAPPPFVGLGGVDVNTSSQPKAGDSKKDNVKVKETQVPDEIAKTVESLKTYTKQQKSLSSDIGRASISKLSSISNEIQTLQWSLQDIANNVESNYNQIKLLRKETSRLIQSMEMAQRTHDTPAGLQFENNAPFLYFQNLVQKYETDLINFRNQIVLTESHMKSLTNPQSISPEDLKRCLKQINESFISLAGRFNEIHQKVETQKEQYLNLRKYRLRDSTNVFAKLEVAESPETSNRVSTGPTPFSNISAMSMWGRSFGGSGVNATNQSGKA